MIPECYVLPAVSGQYEHWPSTGQTVQDRQDSQPHPQHLDVHDVRIDDSSIMQKDSTTARVKQSW